ncbi:MAG: hypothetical protein GY708_23965 [Actinomycetia bacterium]|nr:hypothetical protein [Actinomycetes bacterium]
MTRGEVSWYEAPETKPRQYLVLTRTVVIDVLGSVVAAPATRVTRDIPTVSKTLPVERITRSSPIRMEQVCSALAFAVDC